MPDSQEPTIDRRRFLANATAAVVAGPLARIAAPQPLPQGADSPTATVIQVSSDHLVRGRIVHKTILDEVLELVLLRVTEQKNSADAWRSLLRPDDLIGIKFNSSGAAGLGVSRNFADALINSLLAAGFEARQIVPIEMPDDFYRPRGLVRPAYGWNDQPTDFNSGRDRLAAWLRQVTAIINVPFLKTHNIAGITGALKNLSHAVVKNPARFHAQHCSPYIGDIVAIPTIRDKLRLHLTNALRVVFDHGPEARDEFTWDAGTVLASRDPVALDAVGMDIINSQRAVLGIPAIDRGQKLTGYLRAAAQRGLGHYKRRWISTTRLRI